MQMVIKKENKAFGRDKPINPGLLGGNLLVGLRMVILIVLILVERLLHLTGKSVVRLVVTP
jgi:hypothetical protein